MRGKCFGLILLLIAASAAAQQTPGDLSGYLPASGEVAGLTLSDAPKNYRGEDLFAMIDGGADIYFEYGFTQVLRAEYVDVREKLIKLEIYEMESPGAAYGIYTFKVGEGGKALEIGQEALLEEYYLNFWKGNLRGSLGVMNSTIFDTQNIFRVREGMIGTAGDCQAFVFLYTDEGERAEAFDHATARLSVSPKFMSHALQGKQYSMVGREQEFVFIKQAGRYIAIVIGRNQDNVKSTSDQLAEKLAQADHAR